MSSFSPQKTRLSNVWKIGTHLLYTPPYRRGISWTLGLLFGIQFCIFGVTVAFAVLDTVDGNGGIAFVHWALIPLIIFVVSFIDSVHRFQRTLGPIRAIVTASVTLSLWIVYVFLGFLPDYVYGLFGVLAAPGLATSFVYLVLASLAFARQRKHDRTSKTMATTAGFELAPRGGPLAVSTHSASTTDVARQYDEPTEVNVESQSWTPLK